MKKRASWSFAALALGTSLSALADYKLNLQTPVTKLGEEVYDLHTFLLVICSVIFVVVFGAMFYSIFKHRKAAGHKAANFHESTTVEIVWTIIPALILVAMAWPATKVIIAQKDTRGADMTIKVTGYQWKWGYDYLDEGISFHSRLATPQEQYENYEGQKPVRNADYMLEVDNPVVVPVGKRVRLLLTANDVIHSWWVPAFAVKQDAIPGYIRDTWFKAEKEGVYRGQCVELCGKDHGFMPIVVNVVSQEKYDAWVGEQKKLMAANQDDPNKVWTLPEMVARGQKVYDSNCAICHQANGKGQGAFPALDGSKMVVGPKADQVHLLLKGKGAMPAWEKTLSDTEIAAAITFTRNSWGNKTGELIQPAEIKAARSM
ncbi:cytochrome c oxidase subunit II [Chitinimonas viridis]|uniref:Cytochrome c oxidase subunit 2 n=2 Tax=Chitinimonas TaxID=240411 RepID=A0ABT8B3G5_9NEIS|nr:MULTISPECIES: cytochrome c oxidase subunit II [Chitinimonas]MDN3576559.1 cytochrome c oxidase subunit II [Chitinimonas viridis]GLR11496.1 hypothetical protein GCM10007907_02860 [Chitinimonas prasina]